MPIIDARYYKSLVICPTKAMSVELQPILAHGLPLAPVQEVHTYPGRRELVDLIRSVDPKICFLDCSTNTDQALSVISDLLAVSPGLPIVALLGANHDPNVMLRSLRQGACEFLIRPFTPDQLDAAVEKIARLHPPPTSRRGGGGKLVGIVPAKGASGATTIACSLAYQAKKAGAKNALLCDFDPITGTVSFVLKLKSNYSFLDFLHRQADGLDGDLWKQIVLPNNGVDILLSPENVFDYAADLPSAAPMLEFAQASYEFIVVDCSHAYGNWNLSIANTCDELVLVTSNELPSLQAAQKTLMYYETHHVDTSKVRVVVNRYQRDAGLHSDHIGQALQAEILQVIPHDYEAVQKSLMDGKPVSSGSTMGKGIAQIAERLVSAKDREEAKKQGGRGGLFSSIFSR